MACSGTFGLRPRVATRGRWLCGLKVAAGRRSIALLLAIACLAFRWDAGAAAEEDWIGTPLPGAAIIETFTRNYLLGEDDGGRPFLLRFTADGNVEIRSADGRSLAGRWRVGDASVCVTWDDTAAESCHDVYLDGNIVNFADGTRLVRSTRLRLDPPDWMTP